MQDNKWNENMLCVFCIRFLWQGPVMFLWLSSPVVFSHAFLSSSVILFSAALVLSPAYALLGHWSA